MQVYADNASSTKVRQEVVDAMNECNEYYGNPSSVHTLGKKSKELINTARSQIAQSINAESNEIIFTSGGTESNNFALQGYINAYGNERNHIVTTSIEHISVLKTLSYLYRQGYDVTYLSVDTEGRINVQQLQNLIRRNTILISVMFANNEIGTIQPIKEIGEIARQYGIRFHTDAVQAFGHFDIDVDELGIDMMSMSGHKIHAPKGVGALYVKNDIDLCPIMHGSNQEFGLRPGAENVNAIVGMGKAVELLDAEREQNTAHLSMLKDKFIDRIMAKISDVKLNGSIKNSLCNIVNLSFTGVDGNALLMELDSKGIYVSRSSTYSSRHSKPSHVLTAIGVPDDLEYGSLRFSFSRYNTENDTDYILDILPNLVENLRKEAL